MAVGRWHGLVVDCLDPRALAGFWEQVLGMQRVQDEPAWVVIGDTPDRPGMAFAQVAELAPPRWPDADSPQRMHLDVRVDDLDAAEAQVLSLGAARQDGGGERFRVFTDPSGHPFCLVSF